MKNVCKICTEYFMHNLPPNLFLISESKINLNSYAILFTVRFMPEGCFETYGYSYSLIIRLIFIFSISRV